MSVAFGSIPHRAGRAAARCYRFVAPHQRDGSPHHEIVKPKTRSFRIGKAEVLRVSIGVVTARSSRIGKAKASSDSSARLLAAAIRSVALKPAAFISSRLKPAAYCSVALKTASSRSVRLESSAWDRKGF